jgi:hypothetical protein
MARNPDPTIDTDLEIVAANIFRHGRNPSPDFLDKVRAILGIPDDVPYGPPTAANPETIPAAPADEVLVEQLEYLLKHARSGRHLHCSDCERLGRVTAELMTPFTSRRTRGAR